MPFDLTQLVAEPSYAPKAWQSSAPREVWGHRPPVANSTELQRILALPRRAQEIDGTERAEAIINMITERFTTHNTRCRCAQIDPERHAAEGCIDRLRLVQALALREIGIAGGLLGPIGVGHGKTLIDLLAVLALKPFNAQLCVLLVPPKLVTQLAADYDYIGQHFRMPSMIVQGNSSYDRPRPGQPILQVMPYTRMSHKDATSWLKTVRPDAVVADECHKLRDRNTAATSRVMRHFDELPSTRFCGWSGSITSKSIRDYAHLAALALKFGSPLPIDYEVVEDWARAIDPCPNPADPGPLLQGLIDTGCVEPGESLYRGIRRRIAETVGVVSTTQPSVQCGLEILERKAPTIPPQIAQNIRDALEHRRPDGEELVTAMQAVECAIECAMGFHYRWIYPKHVFPRDTMLILDWLELRKVWHRELRAKLKIRDEHLDSPQLLLHAAQRHFGDRPKHKGLPEWESRAYCAWRDIKPRVQYESDAVRIDDYLVRDTARWMQSHNGIVWYQHTAFAEWLAEHTGLPVYGGGDAAKRALVGDAAHGIPGEPGTRSAICSIKAHGTGTNKLQFKFHEQLFQCGPADPAAWEQAIGRLYRPGQPSPTVKAWFYLHTKELRRRVQTALRAASYVEGTMGGEHSLRVGIPLGLEAELDDEDLK